MFSVTPQLNTQYPLIPIIQKQPPQPNHNQSTLRALFNRSTRLIKDTYDLILLNFVLPVLGLIYFKHSSCPNLLRTHHLSSIHLPTSSSHSSSSYNGVVTFSTLVGQFFFGYIGDAYGRHKLYSIDLMIIILSTLFCALSRGSDDTGTNGGGAVVIKYLTFWRILLAFGLGRDYPISATVPSDKAVLTYRRRERGQLIAILTSIQGLGNLMASTMTLMVLVRFSVLIVADEAESDAESMDLVWRICIAVGCLPALSTSLVRFTMPPTILMSTSRMSMYSQSYDDIDEIQLSNNCKDQLSFSKTNDNILPHLTAHTASPPLPPKTYQRRRQSTVFREYCSQWENLKVLIGTSLPWFLLDLEFRSISLNQSYLLDFMGMIDDHNNNSNTTAALNSTSPNNNSTTLYRHLRMTSLGNLTVSLLGIVPGYWFVIFSIEKMGCTRAQFLCFAVLLLFCTLLSTAFHQLKVLVPLFITTFTLSQFFSNLRRSTPFVVPGEVFPTRVRATAQGVSAGTGKIGAVLVTLMFNRLVEIDSRSRTLRGGSLSGTTTTTMVGIGVVLSVMIVGFLAMTFVFPRGARRLSSKA